MMENDANESKPGCLTASLIAPFNEERQKSLKRGRGKRRRQELGVGRLAGK